MTLPISWLIRFMVLQPTDNLNLSVVLRNTQAGTKVGLRKYFEIHL